jgi:phosphopantetheinyl transferase
VEPRSQSSSASGGAGFAGAAAVMQAVETETLILYHTDLRGQWPAAAARALAKRLPYQRRLAVSANSAAARASLAGIALALRALTRLLGRGVDAGELKFAAGAKPRLRGARADAQADFSISHSDCWVACAALAHGRVGLDLEMGRAARVREWVLREALLKARGEGLRALAGLHDLEVDGTQLRSRGEQWHFERPGQFSGASACIVSSRKPARIEAHALPLSALFAP